MMNFLSFLQLLGVVCHESVHRTVYLTLSKAFFTWHAKMKHVVARRAHVPMTRWWKVKDMADQGQDSLTWKLRIAMLWLCGPILELGHLMFTIEATGGWLKRLGDLLVHSTFFLTLPVMLAVLTVVLPDGWSKKLNVVFGILPGMVFYTLNLLEFGFGLVPGGYSGPTPGPEQAIILGVRLAITVLIPVLAFKWPRFPVSSAPVTSPRTGTGTEGIS